MLDDLKYIHEKDQQDALGIATKQTKQLLHDFKISYKPKNKITNVVFAGMGGSALAATISSSVPGYNVPFEILRQYNIPSYVDKSTLFIACSYSGNTEETLSALKQAEDAKANIVIISSGGKLEEIAKQKKYEYIFIPKAEQPRYAVLYNLKAVWQLMSINGLLNEEIEDLKKVVKFLDKEIELFLPTVSSKKNPAKKLALEMMGKSSVIYSGPFLAPAAYKWKISINENAKNVAWEGVLPEFSHNEFIGWSSHPHNKPYCIINLRSNFEHSQIDKRFDVSTKLLSGKRPHPVDVVAKGKTDVEQILWTIIFGDFTSLYLGLLNGVNPTPVDLVEKMKKELV